MHIACGGEILHNVVEIIFCVCVFFQHVGPRNLLSCVVFFFICLEVKVALHSALHICFPSLVGGDQRAYVQGCEHLLRFFSISVMFGQSKHNCIDCLWTVLQRLSEILAEGCTRNWPYIRQCPFSIVLIWKYSNIRIIRLESQKMVAWFPPTHNIQFRKLDAQTRSTIDRHIPTLHMVLFEFVGCLRASRPKHHFFY